MCGSMGCMGKIEKGAKELRRKGYFQTAVLSTIGVAGILLVGAVAPNTVQLLEKFGVMKRLRERTQSAMTRLARKKLIVFMEKNGKRYTRITEAGKRALMYERQKTALTGLKSSRRRWDGRYRIVMFDVPEKRRKIRVRLREMMRAGGFLRLQDSVWIFPYDCEDFITLLKADLHIGKDALYAVVEKIENDRWIRNHFDLSVR